MQNILHSLRALLAATCSDLNACLAWCVLVASYSSNMDVTGRCGLFPLLYRSKEQKLFSMSSHLLWCSSSHRCRVSVLQPDVSSLLTGQGDLYAAEKRITEILHPLLVPTSSLCLSKIKFPQMKRILKLSKQHSKIFWNGSRTLLVFGIALTSLLGNLPQALVRSS